MKDMLKLRGCGTALVTPFKNGEVDYESYAALVDRQVGAGVDFLVALATTAETPALSPEEKVRLLCLTREHCGSLPVVVGCGSNAVQPTLANMALLEPHGVDAWLVVVPFYNKPTQEGQYQYFKAIASSTDKPVMIYNVPGRTGANMEASTCVRLAHDVDNIFAIKEASGRFDQVVEILKNAPVGFTVLSGDDDMTLRIMREGAAGVISVASNIAPAEVTAMCAAALSSDFDEAGRLDSALNPLFRNCFVESNPIPVKSGLAHLGLCSAEVRLPLSEATESTVSIISSTIDSLNIKE